MSPHAGVALLAPAGSCSGDRRAHAQLHACVCSTTSALVEPNVLRSITAEIHHCCDPSQVPAGCRADRRGNERLCLTYMHASRGPAGMPSSLSACSRDCWPGALKRKGAQSEHLRQEPVVAWVVEHCLASARACGIAAARSCAVSGLHGIASQNAGRGACSSTSPAQSPVYVEADYVEAGLTPGAGCTLHARIRPSTGMNHWAPPEPWFHSGQPCWVVFLVFLRSVARTG